MRRRPKKRPSKKRNKDRTLVAPVCLAAAAGLAGTVAFGFPAGAVAGPAAVAAWEAGSVYKALKLNETIQKRTSTPKFSQVKSEAKKSGVRIVGEPGSHAKKLAAGILARMVLTLVVCVAACAAIGVLAEPKTGFTFSALLGAAAGVTLAAVVADPRGEAWGKTRGGISSEIKAVADCLETGRVAVIVIGFVPKRKIAVIGDIDLVVVLQDGALAAIEVKSGSGQVTEHGDQILVAGRTLPGRPALQSARAGEVLSQQTGRPVQAILYLPRGQASTRSRAADTAIIGGPQNLSRALAVSHLDLAEVKAAAKSIGVRIR